MEMENDLQIVTSFASYKIKYILLIWGLVASVIKGKDSIPILSYRQENNLRRKKPIEYLMKRNHCGR